MPLPPAWRLDNDTMKRGLIVIQCHSGWPKRWQMRSCAYGTRRRSRRPLEEALQCHANLSPVIGRQSAACSIRFRCGVEVMLPDTDHCPPAAGPAGQGRPDLRRHHVVSARGGPPDPQGGAREGSIEIRRAARSHLARPGRHSAMLCVGDTPPSAVASRRRSSPDLPACAHPSTGRHEICTCRWRAPGTGRACHAGFARRISAATLRALTP